MKRIVLLLLAILCFAAVARADGPRAMLMTRYIQAGWGDKVEVGYIDEDGRAYTLTGYQNELGFPYKPSEQLDFLLNSDKVEFAGELDKDTLWDLKSLVACVSDQSIITLGGANDAGTQESLAFRYNGDDLETVRLGASGDDAWENTDPNAQALYRALRLIFPGVTDYDGERSMSPAGFKPTSLLSFCAIENADFEGATVTVSEMSCEEGPIPREITKEQAEEFLKDLRDYVVTGKKNAVSVTGGTTAYGVYDKNGGHIVSIELYGGALVRPDGMYYISITP